VGVVEHVVVDDLGTSAVASAFAGGCLARFSRMYSCSDSAMPAKKANRTTPCPLGVVDALERAGEEFEADGGRA